MSPSSSHPAGFTLIELLVVIAIIAVLMGLAFPVFQNVQNSAKKTQAKNDLVQIANAINAVYTEYGQYPCGAQPGGDGSDFFVGDDNNRLFTILRGLAESGEDLTRNPRKIAFMQIPAAKDTTHAKAKSGICGSGHYHDPWGSPYRVKMDNNYNNLLENPYSDNSGAGWGTLNQGAIAWSLGRDLDGAKTGAKGNGGAKNSGKAKDDVISWQ